MNDDLIKKLRDPMAHFEYGDKLLVADELDSLRADLQKLAYHSWVNIEVTKR
jgi:hypothetical protein